jgi:hypothetical protein
MQAPARLQAGARAPAGRVTAALARSGAAGARGAAARRVRGASAAPPPPARAPRGPARVAPRGRAGAAARAAAPAAPLPVLPPSVPRAAAKHRFTLANGGMVRAGVGGWAQLGCVCRGGTGGKGPGGPRTPAPGRPRGRSAGAAAARRPGGPPRSFPAPLPLRTPRPPAQLTPPPHPPPPQVYCAVEAKEQEFIVTVSVPGESVPDGAAPLLQWCGAARGGARGAGGRVGAARRAPTAGPGLASQAAGSCGAAAAASQGSRRPLGRLPAPPARVTCPFPTPTPLQGHVPHSGHPLAAPIRLGAVRQPEGRRQRRGALSAGPGRAARPLGGDAAREAAARAAAAGVQPGRARCGAVGRGPCMLGWGRGEGLNGGGAVVGYRLALLFAPSNPAGRSPPLSPPRTHPKHPRPRPAPLDMNLALGPRGGGHFAVPVGMAAGTPEPLGPSLVAVTAGSGPDATATLNFSVGGLLGVGTGNRGSWWGVRHRAWQEGDQPAPPALPHNSQAQPHHPHPPRVPPPPPRPPPPPPPGLLPPRALHVAVRHARRRLRVPRGRA